MMKAKKTEENISKEKSKEKSTLGFKESLKRVLNNFGSATGKILKSMDDAEKEIMKKSGVEQFK